MCKGKTNQFVFFVGLYYFLKYFPHPILTKFIFPTLWVFLTITISIYFQLFSLKKNVAITFMSETTEKLKCDVATLTETVNKLLMRVKELENENEELKETIDRLIAYKVLKKHVLNELLFVVNGIVYDKQASDVLPSGKVLRQHFEVDKIIDYARKWMEVNRLDEFRCHNCDRHARVVFASICGNVSEEWVQNNTINTNTMSANNYVVTEKMSLGEGLLKKQELFEQNQPQCAILIRLVKTIDNGDGHSFVIYKDCNGHVHTVQSSFGKAQLSSIPRDVFTNELVETIETGQKVWYGSFGIACDDNLQECDRWVCENECYFVYRKY